MSRVQRPYRTPPRRARSPGTTTSPASLSHSLSYAVAFALIVVLLVAGVYGYNLVFGAINQITSAEDVRVVPAPQQSAPPPALLQRPFNLLVVGVDVRKDADQEGVRSDTLIVVHVDPQARWASMLSIPRDTVVEIPAACSTQKINAAYSCGYDNPSLYDHVTDPRDSGAALAADTVEDYLDITIDYTMQVDFNGFQRLVDAVGGITVDVPRAILDPEYPTDDNGYMRLYYPTGLQRMNGEQALRYARTRHVDSDFGRAQRQQQVVQAGLDELQRQNLLERIETAPRLLDALSQSVRTTLPINNLSTIQGLAALAQELNGDRIKRLVLQPETNPDGSSTLRGDYTNLEWDPAYLRRQVEALQTPPDRQAAGVRPTVVQIQNGTGRASLVDRVSSTLDEHGFELAPAADAPTTDLGITTVVNYRADAAIAQDVAAALGLDEQAVVSDPADAAPPNVDIVVRLGDDYQPPDDADDTAQR